VSDEQVRRMCDVQRETMRRGDRGEGRRGGDEESLGFSVGRVVYVVQMRD
jgi:hypothetical protein